MANIVTKPLEEIIGQEMKGYVTISKILYPKKGMVTDIVPGEWGILVLNVRDVTDGAIPSDAHGGNGYEIVAKGPIPCIDFGVVYYFEGCLTEDPKYGMQYKIKQLHKVFKLENTHQKEIFLKAILGDSKADLLLSNLEDPIATLEEEDLDALSGIKGIGKISAKTLVEKYRKNMGSGEDFVQLQDYGLTPNMISKLQSVFKSTDTILYFAQNNPYVFIDAVDSIGWSRADAIALNGGYDPCGPARIAAFIKHFLKEQANSEGHSWVNIDVLVNAIKEIAPLLETSALQEMLREWSDIGGEHPDKKWLFYDRPTRRIGLMYYYKLEEDIAAELLRLQHSTVKQYSNEEIQKAIEEAEEENGFQYTEEQCKGIVACINNPVSILSGSAGCVDCDTEYFNGTEWKKIANYTKGEKVLQYNTDGTAELVVPSDYVKYPEENLWLVQTKYGLDMCLSEEHNVYYLTSKNNLIHKPFKQIMELHNSSSGGFSGKFITSFHYNGQGIDLSDAEIKLMLAVICDGSFPSDNTNHCRFHIKKDRKKEALRKVFAEAGVSYKEKESVAKGYTDFYCYPPLKIKTFTQEWYNCSQRQLQLICDNILQWDGCEKNGKRTFSSTVKNTADFVQFAFASCGYRATLSVYDRRGQINSYGTVRTSIEYTVTITERNLVSMGGFHANNPNKTKIAPYKTRDGYKYCFTVPTHMWIMRRNGKVVVTGNTGKSFSMRPITRLFRNEGVDFAQCALAGKASSNLSEITGEEGFTIHRLLGWTEKGFTHNEHNPLPLKAIILDELSLVGGEIFLSLLKAIPNGGRLIMLGDPNQLEAIGLANLLKDCVNSYVIPNTRLIKIHRQAARSGIITESLRASAGDQFVPQLPISELRGELKDLKIVTYTDSFLSTTMLMAEYKELYYTRKINPHDIGVVVPMRMRGGLSCYTLNKEIQSLTNGLPRVRGEEVAIHSKEGDYTLRPDDKILITKNIYRRVFDTQGRETPVFNGNTGYIIAIVDKSIGGESLKKYLKVKLIQQGIVYIPQQFWSYVELGYAISCHRMQGSSSPYVIVGLDMTAYALLSKEWLYTALTRAKKFCVLVSQIAAVRKAVAISRVTTKHTWLQEFLIAKEQEFQQTGVIKRSQGNLGTYLEIFQGLEKAQNNYTKSQ